MDPNSVEVLEAIEHLGNMIILAYALGMILLVVVFALLTKTVTKSFALTIKAIKEQNR